ncbi:hypothetical protein ILUMI_15241 [Ignelater luminosus]|uniref:Uncharacterized protein n=1 Tax=Ignelater luminosus TaxID=2038154 RepID=A0A8K0CV25_IGNLU|nr:hypothetical protein ILUMI_15241 [Ignelater luminosus]
MVSYTPNRVGNQDVIADPEEQPAIENEETPAAEVRRSERPRRQPTYLNDVEYNGRDGLAAFGLGIANLDNKVGNVMQVESLEIYVEEYAELFKDELGTYKHTIVK